MKNKIILSILAVVGATLFLSDSVSATINPNIGIQDKEYGFSVSPAYIDFDIAPGKTSTDTIRLRNTGRNEVDVKIGISPLSVQDESYSNLNITDFSPRTEIVRWTNLSVDNGCSIFDEDSDGSIYLHLRVQEECNVRYSVKTPSTAPSGSQHMNIFFQLYDDSVTSDSGIKIIQSIGVSSYAQNREGDAITCVDIKKQKIPFWVFSGPLQTTYVAENCGNLDTYVESFLEVKNLMGNTVYKSYAEKDGKWKITASDQRRIVLADTSRLVDINWEEAGLGIFNVIQTVKVGNEVFEKTSIVFLIPLWMLIAVLICIFLIVVVIITNRRKKSNSKLRRK